MRLFSLLLALILVVCPQLCRAEPLGCCAEACGDTSPGDHSNLPEPAQNDAVSCICAGAIQGIDPQLETKSLSGEWLPVVFRLPEALLSAGSVPLVSFGGSFPSGMARPPHRIHLMFQNFRC